MTYVCKDCSTPFEAYNIHSDDIVRCPRCYSSNVKPPHTISNTEFREILEKAVVSCGANKRFK